MNFEEYLLKELSSLNLQVNENIDTDNVADLIFKLLMSKKFRKYAVEPSYQEYILNSIKDSVKNNQPIELTFPFGAYKLWRLEESPEVDWAELFCLMYFAKWLKPITDIYEPGVWFDFYSDDVIIEKLNNIPKSDTEAYIQSFKDHIKFIEKYIPHNLKFTLNRVAEQYDDLQEFEQEFEQIKQSIKDEVYCTPLTTKQIAMIDLNVKLRDGQGDDVNWREKVNLIHEAYSRTSKKRPYYRNGHKILTFTQPIKDSIAVGTTKRSIAKFWTGVGVVQKEGDDYLPYIYSPKQLEVNKFTIEKVKIDGLSGKNFSSVKVVIKL